MKFWGGCLKLLSLLVLLIGTIVCTIVIITEGIQLGYTEAIWIMAGVWVAVLLAVIFFWNIGSALVQLSKLKKRVAALEQWILQHPFTQQTYSAPPVSEVIHAESSAKVDVVPITEVPLPVTPTFAAKEHSPSAQPSVVKRTFAAKKWLPAAIVGTVVVIVILLIVLIGGKKNTPSAEPIYNNDSFTQTPVITSPAETEDEASYVAPNALPVHFGSSIEHPDFSMSVDSLEILDEFTYATSEHFSTSLYVETGYKLLMLRGHFTNLGTSPISESAFARSVLVNGNYFLEGYDVRMDFMRKNDSEIDPYSDLDYVIYVNIPKNLAEQFETATFTIGFKEDLSNLVTELDANGNRIIPVDKLYSISGGLDSSKENTADAVNKNEHVASISIGETIYTNDYEFTLRDVELTYEVLPPNTGSVYSSYVADSGKVFVHVEADVKNIMQRDIRIDELYTASVLYDGAYPYSGFTVVNDGNRFDWSSSYVAATPLETCGTHSLIECPIEVDHSGKSIVVTLNIGGEFYEYILR